MVATIRNVRDPNTLSNYQNWITTHTVANFGIDFEQKALSGNVILFLKARNKDEKPEILLDTSYLDVDRVKLNGQEIKHDLISRFEPYGSALKIQVPANHDGENVELSVGAVLGSYLAKHADRPTTDRNQNYCEMHSATMANSCSNGWEASVYVYVHWISHSSSKP